MIAHVPVDAGRTLVVNDDDGAIGFCLDARGDHGGIGHLAPWYLHAIELHRQALGDRGKAFAELAVLDDQNGVAGGQHVDEGCFHPGGSRTA
jgi:hypothetical protein